MEDLEKCQIALKFMESHGNWGKKLYLTDLILAVILSFKIRKYIVSLQMSWKSHRMVAVRVIELYLEESKNPVMVPATYRS